MSLADTTLMQGARQARIRWPYLGRLWCPQSDSNRHLADFKSAASANWAMGALQLRAYFAQFQPFPDVLNTAVIPQCY